MLFGGLKRTRKKVRSGTSRLEVHALIRVDELAARRDRVQFGEVKRFCLFVGFPRSGHSLVGAMLDAHPDMVVAHEFGALGFVQRGWTRSALFGAIMKSDRKFAASGWKNTDRYEYEVLGQWQGRIRQLRVIGEKSGGDSSPLLNANPKLLDRLAELVGVPLGIVVVVRNPYDNIARIARRDESTLLAAIVKYEVGAQAVEMALKVLSPHKVIVLYHEDTVTDPRATLRRLAAFFEVDSDAGWINDCAALVLPQPRIARFDVDWSPAERLAADECIERHEFLARYEDSWAT